MKKIFLLAAVMFLLSMMVTGCGNKKTISSNETVSNAENPEEKFPVEAKYSCDLGSISIRLPEDWDYTIEEYTDSESEFGIRFYPDNAVEGSVAVKYWNGFGVCGTGLKEMETTVNNMTARMGVYDDLPYWSFMVLTGAYDGYVITNDSAGEWWEDYGELVEEILGTLVIKVK